MAKYINQLKITGITGLLTMLTLVGYGQMKPEEEFNFIKEKYPEESAVYVKKSETVTYDIVGDSIITTIKTHIELMHLADKSIYSNDQVHSSSFSEISNLKAYTLIPKKRKYEKVEVKEFKESFDKDSYVFFDDTKKISFTYPAVQKGAKTVLEYTRTVKDPKLMGLFYFNSYLPIHEAEYIIDYNKEISLRPQFFNNDDLNFEHKEETLNENRGRLLFRASEIEKIKFDSESPSYSHIAASVYCPVKQYRLTNGTIQEVISTPENLHKWYRTFLKDLHGNDNEIKELVTSLVSPEDEVMDKVRKIYYWVQSNIKYIAFEDGMRGFTPHQGSYVIDKRYGDCKDMASTIVSMLREAGIDAQYTWIGSRELPYNYSETPSPITDNHMIATFTYEGTTYYLDATGSYTPLDLPTSMIQGKQCLVSLDQDNFEIKTVPVIPKEKSTVIDSVTVSLDQGVIRGKGYAQLTGYLKVFSTYKFIKSNEKSVDNYTKGILKKGNNKFQIDQYTHQNVSDLEKPIVIDYDFNIPDYYKEIGDKIYVNLLLDKSFNDALIEDRSLPLESDFKYVKKNIVKMAIPDGFEVGKLPESVANNDDNFGFKIDYKVTDNDIIVTQEYYEDYLIMEPEDFESWNSTISNYSKACRKAIILKKKK